jgi:hypothetical protein
MGDFPALFYILDDASRGAALRWNSVALAYVPIQVLPAMRLRHISTLLLLTTGFCASAADYPLARVITNPGPEYADTARSWQGIPGIERASNGRLWSTWYTGDVGEGAIGNYAMVATSDDEGRKWSKPTAIQGPKGTRIGDPLPWIDPKGRLWVFYTQLTEKTDTTPTLRATFAIRCDDPQQAAPRWTTPFVVAEDGILFGKPIIRTDGAWVAPFFVTGNPPWSDQVAGRETGTLISTNDGATWKWLGGTSIPESLRNFSEATLAQRKDGSLFMVIRTSVGLYQSVSKDGGNAWDEATPLPCSVKGRSSLAFMWYLNSVAFILFYV